MKNRTLIASLLMASLLGTVPGMALADDRGHYKPSKEERRHYRDNNHYRHDNHDYGHHDGRFYRPRPTVGAIFTSLPIGFAVVVAGDHTYFHAEGSYYRQAPAGYMVCEKPVIAPAPRLHRKHFAGKIVVRPALLNVRSGPGRSFAISGQVLRGERLHIRGSSDGWYYVKTPGGINGWVMERFTAPHAAG